MMAVAQPQTHSFEDKRAIIAPLISIIGRDQVRDATPISLFDIMQKIFGVAIDLTLWLPQPDAIQTDCESQDESSKPSGPKFNAHKSIRRFVVMSCILRASGKIARASCRKRK